MRSVVVVFGLSGTGKSFVSRILHERFGYEWLRSDVIRKELMGLSPDTKMGAKFGEGIYTEDITRKVYREMIDRAKSLVRNGKRVVLDATFLRKWQRDLVRENFPEALFIMTFADDETVSERLKVREDVSDADYGIYLKQKGFFEKPEQEEAHKLDTRKSEDELLSILKNLVED